MNASLILYSYRKLDNSKNYCSDEDSVQVTCTAMTLQGAGYVYVPTISPDRSGIRGAVSRPTYRCIVTL
jgi:hypothetical protein